MLDLRCVDCVDGMLSLPRESVDVVVTSPPYNVGTRYGVHDDNIPWDEYILWTEGWVANVERVLSQSGSFFLNIAGKPSEPWCPFDVAHVVRESGLCLQNTIHWVKSVAVNVCDEDVVFGHYKPINSDRYLNGCHEYIFHFTRTGKVNLDRLSLGVPYRDKTNINRWNRDKDLHCRGNVWVIPYKTIRSREKDRPHPATFPVEIPEWCLRLHGVERARCFLDPFVGIGTSAIAALRLRIPSFVGFDYDEAYIEEARRRVEAEVARLGVEAFG